ncbi:hypothetical protein [Spiroplasma endosymbiont of Labia minor]|uniref:hypothetical protein n=1 Tax=Spiroplasma endosymbiont of Labia minor TaxID=3066305 RepID=UPI0030D3123F
MTTLYSSNEGIGRSSIIFTNMNALLTLDDGSTYNIFSSPFDLCMSSNKLTNSQIYEILIAHLVQYLQYIQKNYLIIWVVL